jgi:hypothetical protein
VIIRFFEEVIFQLLLDQMVKQIHYMFDWLSAFPWQFGWREGSGHALTINARLMPGHALTINARLMPGHARAVEGQRERLSLDYGVRHWPMLTTVRCFLI